VTNALIVDDSRVVRRFARNILETIGFDCTEAVNGLQALQICRTIMPDLILLDCPKILFCTTHNDMSYIERALEAGSDEYVMKPFDKDIIESKLRNVGFSI
jgi:two-component system chemotaxis response regulator CheY